MRADKHAQHSWTTSAQSHLQSQFKHPTIDCAANDFTTVRASAATTKKH
jgi:hypothetical protein